MKPLRTIDTSWDYRGVNTKEYTHCYHNYPAMMIPQIARRLISESKVKKNSILFDPYCGSGTSLVEAQVSGIHSIGTDLNPLARLISETKNTHFNFYEIVKNVAVIKEQCFAFEVSANNEIDFYNTSTYDSKFEDDYLGFIPNFYNREYWFSKEALLSLGFLKHLIETIPSPELKSFFLVPLSEVARESSYTRNSEFKLFRIQEEKLHNFKPEVFKKYFIKLERNLMGLKSFNDICQSHSNFAKVYDFNTCDGIDPNIIPNDSIDVVVTSPPYGDSRTTVAYGQFSMLSSNILGFENANKVDKTLMGGKIIPHTISEIPKSCSDELQKISEVSEKRFYEVASFLTDYKNSITNVSKVIKKGGRACYVLGNRTVKGIQIPLDYVTVEFFSEQGYKHLDTIVRNIPNKRMPKANSPTNIVGQTSETMNKEYIVILQKL